MYHGGVAVMLLLATMLLAVFAPKKLPWLEGVTPPPVARTVAGAAATSCVALISAAVVKIGPKRKAPFPELYVGNTSRPRTEGSSGHNRRDHGKFPVPSTWGSAISESASSESSANDVSSEEESDDDDSIGNAAVGEGEPGASGEARASSKAAKIWTNEQFPEGSTPMQACPPHLPRSHHCHSVIVGAVV